MEQADTNRPWRLLESTSVRIMTRMLIDAFAWTLALVAAVSFRYDFDTSRVDWLALSIAIFAAIALQVVVGTFTSLYKGKFSYGSFAEIKLLANSVVIAALALGLVTSLFPTTNTLPRSTVFITFPIVLIFMFTIRYVIRLYFERKNNGSKNSSTGAATLIVGAGFLGEYLAHTINDRAQSEYSVVGFLDDNKHKKNLVIHGIPVLGRSKDIASVANKTGAEVLVIGVGNAESALIRKLTDLGEAAGLKVMVMPPLDQILGNNSSPADLRKVSIEDLIGRSPVDTDVASIAGYITGKRVLITGAGGSIGSELSRQISKFGPSELNMLDRDETGLQLAQLATAGHGLLDTKEVLLADIREEEVIREIFEDRRPQVVFHAAALKHLPMLEQYPDEAWKTNVLGTLNVLEASRAVGVETFINISTDKAANPTSVLGHSKRVAEKLTSWTAQDTHMPYLSVRFGNVIGSRGSMLPTFQSLIESGGPLTVTHPDITRFFMTIPEACQLVIQAGGIGRPGEVLILDMGTPVSILDVAKRMIAMSGKRIEIVFTGMRNGEKLHEELIGDHEELERPYHEKISHTSAKPITPQRLNKQEWMERITLQRTERLQGSELPEPAATPDSLKI